MHSWARQPTSLTLPALRPEPLAKVGCVHRRPPRVAVSAGLPIFGILCHLDRVIVIGAGVVESYHAGHKGIKAARSQYEAWLDIVGRAQWRNPEDVKASYPKASILKASRVVFNIKGNDYRLVAALQYRAGAVAIRFFGTHGEYDRIDAETV